jgi:TonB-linked SusC/RagA family outer membrane protein
MKKWFKKAGLFTCVLLGSAVWAMAQTVAVTGTVKDATGELLPGVSIAVKGTTVGIITDIEGRFTLGVPANAVLTISYLGYVTQEIPVNGQTELTVTLAEDTQILDEVVVVGYGTQKKSDITGSVTSVPKERLSKLPVTNVLQAVQGAAAGVNITQSSSIPGDAPSAMVRGRNSINASSDPYIVVDGMPLSKTDGSLNDINPNDIASIEILKDASAVAIYGTNGANGVILITTKRGANGKPQIRYSGYVGTEEIAHIMEPGSPDQLLARYAEYARIQGASLYNGGPVKYEYEFDNYTNNRTTDWIDAVTQTGVIQNHNISLAGGAENVKYYISADYMGQKGVVKGYDYKRYSFRTNLDINATKYLTFGASTFIVAHNRDGGRANLLNAAAMSPYARMHNEDGSLTQYPMYSESLWANPLLPTTLNPERRQFNVSVNGYAELDFGKIWKPLDGLKYKLNAGYSYVPKRTSEYEGETVYNLNGWGSIYDEESQTSTVENIITYSKNFDKHHFDLTGLYAAKSKHYQNNTAEASMFFSDELGWNNLGVGATHKVDSYADLYTSASQMGRVNYSYDSRYLFTFTVRRDGSSVFGNNHKYGTFPSVALGWNIAQENFMESTADVLNTLKLRLSYGKSGNEAIGVYQSLTKMSDGMIAMDKASYTTLKAQVSMGNSDLTWETTKSFNAGVDFGLWNNRVNGTVDFYKSNTTDLLLQRNLPLITGYENVWANMGETANTGLEITINSNNLSVNDFSWNTGLVFSWNKSELVDLYGDGKDDVGNRWFIGQPIGVIYDYTKIGIWQEDEIAAGAHLTHDPTALAGDLKLADISGPNGVPDGNIDDNDRSILGQTTPKWIGGITNTFTYKNLALSVFINTVQGAMANNQQIGTASDELGRRNGPAEIGYWTPENKSNEWRSLGNHSNSHGYGFPVDAGYTRIKDATLSYTLPESAVKKIGIGGLQVYVSGRNLYTFTNWVGWDPEARDILRGSDNWAINYPTTRSYVFGINLTF